MNCHVKDSLNVLVTNSWYVDSILISFFQSFHFVSFIHRLVLFTSSSAQVLLPLAHTLGHSLSYLYKFISLLIYRYTIYTITNLIRLTVLPWLSTYPYLRRVIEKLGHTLYAPYYCQRLSIHDF